MSESNERESKISLGDRIFYLYQGGVNVTFIEGWGKRSESVEAHLLYAILEQLQKERQ